MAWTSAANGTLTFEAEYEKAVLFSSPLSGSTYRVHVTSDVLTSFRVVSKTTTGFTIQAGSDITGSVGYDVLV